MEFEHLNLHYSFLFPSMYVDSSPPPCPHLFSSFQRILLVFVSVVYKSERERSVIVIFLVALLFKTSPSPVIHSQRRVGLLVPCFSRTEYWQTHLVQGITDTEFKSATAKSRPEGSLPQHSTPSPGFHTLLTSSSVMFSEFWRRRKLGFFTERLRQTIWLVKR